MPAMGMARVRAIAATVLLPCAMALAACESRPPPTSLDTAPPELHPSRSSDGTGIGFSTASEVAVHDVGDPDPDDLAEYWTPDRMRSARPVVQTVTLGNPLGVLQGVQRRTLPEHLTSALAPRQVSQHPHTSIGKVFFTLSGFDHTCTAAAVTTEGRWGPGSRNLVVTAGHCLSNGFGTFASNFVFAPAYSGGKTPFGLWPAERLFTTSQWHTGFGAALGRDVGFAQLNEGTEKHAGAELHDVVDALGILFTERYPEDGLVDALRIRNGVPLASMGYGILIWGGEDQVRTLSRTSTRDFNFSPFTLGLPSTHTGGSSGGPWIYRYFPTRTDAGFNVVVTVNSYVYGGIDEVYGPQFDDLIHGLWMFASTF